MMCRCQEIREETNKRLAEIEADIMHSQYGFQVIVVKDKHNPFRTRYKILGNPKICNKHRLKSILPAGFKEIVYYVPRN